MPYIKIQTNVELSEDQKMDLLNDLTDLLSKELGKPEKYVMGMIQNSESMIMSGKTDSLAFVELRSIRLPENRTKTLTKSLTYFLKEALKIDSDRIFVNFINVEPHMWGYNSDTFSRK
jgi:phenylpyruvate tautomerase PptA (4-oxalocrotonate tautomerase family)